MTEVEDAKIEYTPSPNAVDITPNKDGGVLKEIKTPGTGDEGPQTGDKVLVHYVGTLTDGTPFDSSRDRGQMFEFDLGKGNVIKAWDIGVASMKRGELAVLTCRGDYAYGKSGSPPKIPPDATLLFEVELFDWKGEDLTSAKDGGVTRSVIEMGEGYATPNEEASCEIHLTGKYNDTVFEDRDVSFCIGEGTDVGLVEGVELAVKKIRKGGKSILYVKSKYAYGLEGNKNYNIPPNADLVYEVELKNFEKAKESWEMDSTEKLEQASLKKGKGTADFKDGNFKKAIRMYKKVVDFLKNEDSLEGEDEQKRTALLLAAHLNLAMCYLKLNNSLEGKNECDNALEIDAKNEKALFRRGTAKINLSDYEDAITDFKTVLDIDPNNKAAKNQIIIANQKIKELKAKEKKIYGGMFQKFAELDSQHEKVNNEKESSEEKNSEHANEDDGEGGDTKETNEAESNKKPEPMETQETASA